MSKEVVVIKKRDIEALLQMEEDRGERFNKMPNDKFMELLPEAWKLPVIEKTRYGRDVRARVYNPFDSSHNFVWIDMPENFYDELEVAVLEDVA